MSILSVVLLRNSYGPKNLLSKIKVFLKAKRQRVTNLGNSEDYGL